MHLPAIGHVEEVLSATVVVNLWYDEKAANHADKHGDDDVIYVGTHDHYYYIYNNSRES
jgi:hypothetical protein